MGSSTNSGTTPTSRLTLESVERDFRRNFSVSGEVTERASEYIPCGFSRSIASYGPHAIYMDHGEGQYVYTIDGRRLLDFHSNFGCNTLGHNHPAILAALLDAVPRGFSFGGPMVHEHRLAQILIERIASVDQVVFTCSASEACLDAVRTARTYTGRTKLAKLEGGFHGIADDFQVSIQPRPLEHAGTPAAPVGVVSAAGLPPSTLADVVVLPQNDLESCERILTEQAQDIACLMLELLPGAGGLVELDRLFVQGLREVTQKLGIVFIADETITLRCAYGGLQEEFSVLPDLTVMGKVIGGGLPLGAIGGRKDIMDVIGSGQVKHAGTHHAHPLATRAGIACMEVMTPEVYTQLTAQGARIKNELNQWALDNSQPFLVSGAGSFLGYEVTDQPGRTYRSVRDLVSYSNEEAMKIVALEFANRGILPLFRGQIALCEPMTDVDIDTFIATCKDIVGGLGAGLTGQTLKPCDR